MPDQKKSSLTLYFFPAFLPLAPLIPFALSAVGALAAFWQRRRPWAKSLAALSFSAAVLTVVLYFARLRPMTVASTDVPPLSRSALIHAQGETAPAPAPDVLPGERWFATPSRRALSAVTVGAGLVVFGTQEGTVEAYDSASGVLRWTLKKHEPFLSSALIAAGKLFVGEGLHTTGRARFTAVDLASGKVAWEREFRGHLEQAPAFDGAKGLIYLCAGQGGLWALSAADGSVAWHADFGHCDASPRTLHDTVYVNVEPSAAKDKGSSLCALSSGDGTPRWCSALPGQPWGEPLVAGGTVYVTTGLGQVGPLLPTDEGWAHAVDAASGSVKWTVKLPTMALLQSVLLDDGKKFVVSLKRGTVMALDAATGKSLWEAEVGHELRAPAVGYRLAGREELVAASFEGKLSFIDGITGKVMNTIDLSGETFSSPAVDGGVVYAASAGQLSALDLSRYRAKRRRREER